jgi:hypothetical protein
MRMRVFFAAALIALTVAPAYAQQKSVPKYGDVDKDKTPQEKAADKAAEQAYQRSLGNIPDKGPTDPWGNMRSDGAPKPEAKAAHAKRTKAGDAAN